MAKKKKNLPGSRYKRMNKIGRLKSANSWLPTAPKDNIVKNYRKRYGVDLLSAIRELEMLGIKLDPKYIEAIKKSVAAKIQENKIKKIEKENSSCGLVYGVDYDDYFSCIAGYTSGDASYGTLWNDT